MPTYDGIGSSVTHEIEVVGDVFISNVEGGSLSTQVPFEIFSNVSGMGSPPTDSRQLRLRVQPTTEASPDDSYVTDMGIQNTTDNYFFITAPQNTSNVGDQNTFVISSTSNVGIGTTNPEKPLHVVGNAWITGTLTASNIVGASPVTISSDLVMASGYTLTAAAIEPPSGSESNLNITGTITTSNITHETELTLTSNLLMGSDKTLTTSNIVAHTGDNLTVSSNFEVGTSNLFVNTANGNVGIGTASPRERLEIHYPTPSYGGVSDQSNYIIISAGGEHSDSGIYFRTPFNSAAPAKMAIFSSGGGYSGASGGGLHFCINNDTDNTTKVTIDNDSKMVIKSDGNVGIGQASPTAPLHITSSDPRMLIGKSDGNGGEIEFGNNSHGVGRNTGQTNFAGINDVVLYTAGEGGAGLKTGGGYLKVTSGGNVGIGVATPDTKLHLKDPPSVTAYGGYRSYIHMEYGAGNWIMAVDNVTNSNHNLYWYANLYPSGTIAKVITFENDQSKNIVVNGNTFTGQHRNFIKGIPSIFSKDFLGMIVSSDNNTYIKLNGDICKGKNAITINESVPLVSLSNIACDKKCFGVISDAEDPNERVDTYGRITSHFHKEKGDTRIFINSLGEGAVWVVNTNGNLESGDYITTSNVAGYGQKQDDDILHNYTVAKITMDCDFNPPQQPVQIILKDAEGNNILDQNDEIQWVDDPDGATEPAYETRQLEGGYIAAFVGCTYHCG